MISRVGVRAQVRTGQGLTIPLDRVPSRTPDLVLVPALGAKTPETLDVALAGAAAASDAAAMVSSFRAQGARVAAACTATFLLASAGLLDVRTATTTWWLAPYFRSRSPG